MTHFTLSPCLIKTDEEKFNITMEALKNYHSILEFSKKWLLLKLLIHQKSIYLNINAYEPPLELQTLASFFQTNILSLWCDLLSDAYIVYDEEYYNFEIPNDYNCVDKPEWNLLCNCLKTLADREILIFVCNSNNITESYISVNEEYKLHTVSNPLVEETEIFNDYLNYPESTVETIFPCVDICRVFVDKAQEEKNASAYKKYGDIIAKRNGFIKLPYDHRRYKPNAPAYKSKNEEFFISLDEMHGTFEVFAAKNHSEPFIAEYGFDGKKLTQKNSRPENHKFYK